MARRLRIEFPGAVYHVLNRGNYRRDLFLSAGEAGAFVKALEEAAAIYGWRIHAYALMRNHYHLAIETPVPNLKAGMHWLQTTFCTRFNRLHGERGHLFQGRYQSLLVEDDAALARLVNYIHLNPVRAKIVSPEQLVAFRWSSLHRFFRNHLFPGLCAETWLKAMGLETNETDWSVYLERLRQLALSPEEQERLGFAAMSRGWAIGTEAWRKAVAKDHAALAINPGLEAEEARALREECWQAGLDRILMEERRTLEEAHVARKNADWKLALAARVRRESGAAIAWLAQKLQLGKPETARNYLSQLARKNTPK